MNLSAAAIQLLFPMVVYAFYIFALSVVLFRSRASAIRSGDVSFKYFRTLSGEPPPEKTLVVGRHFDNQFQSPMLFLITCTLLIVLNAASFFSVVVAWLFVFFRAAHAFTQLGRNDVRKRVVAFAAGLLMLLLLWVQILLFALGAPAV